MYMYVCIYFFVYLFTYLYIHFYYRFDGQFILSWLINQGNLPEIIPSGSKIMAIKLKCLDIRIIDSLNFLPMALAKLPNCFGIKELKKGYFPHLFNKPENQAYVGPQPSAHFYSPETMSDAGRKSFLDWYEQHKDDTFCFQKEILAYCRFVLFSLIFFFISLHFFFIF